MKELTEGIDRSQVAGISFGGQMHGLVTLDDQDQVIRPAILWNDGRTSEEPDYLNNRCFNRHSGCSGIWFGD